MKPCMLFYHLYICNNDWNMWLTEFVGFMNSCGLKKKCDVILCIQYKSPEFKRLDVRSKIVRNYGNYFLKIVENTDNRRYEGNTLSVLYQWCLKQKHNKFVCYLHSKGISKEMLDTEYFPEKWIYDWRFMMLYHCVTKHGICMEMLRKHDAVGCRVMHSPMIHFSGNYWWANSDYIKKLQDPYDVSRYKHKYVRLGCEFWIGNNHLGKDGKWVNRKSNLETLHQPSVKHMKFGYDKSKYIK